MFSLKPLSRDAIPAALAKAERYRLLNEPEQAESICEDVLAADPANEHAVVMLVLALTDQFPTQESGLVSRAQAFVDQLEDPYQRAYYRGLVAERRARALVERGGPASAFTAGDWLREALTWFERAEDLRAAGNDDARLRWNACVRFLMRHGQLREGREESPTPAIMSE